MKSLFTIYVQFMVAGRSNVHNFKIDSRRFRFCYCYCCFVLGRRIRKKKKILIYHLLISLQLKSLWSCVLERKDWLVPVVFFLPATNMPWHSGFLLPNRRSSVLVLLISWAHTCTHCNLQQMRTNLHVAWRPFKRCCHCWRRQGWNHL